MAIRWWELRRHSQHGWELRLLTGVPGPATVFLGGIAQGAFLPKGFQAARKQKVLPRPWQKTSCDQTCGRSSRYKLTILNQP